jgi:hypothetical protein
MTLAGGKILLALSGDRLLAWDERGGAYLRDPGGNWTAEFHIPLEHVWDVDSDEPGFLASGLNGRDSNVVIRFDAEGRELRRRWLISRWRIATRRIERPGKSHGWPFGQPS